jgi:hypothetical protein
MRRSYVVSLIAAGSFAATACSLLNSVDGLTGGAGPALVPEGGEGGGGGLDATSNGDAVSDAAVEASLIRDAGDEAGSNLHPSGTFEGPTCDPWSGYQGTVEKVTDARTGTGACRICTSPTTTDYFTADDKGQGGAATVGASYRAEAWVRTAPGKAVPGASSLFLRSFSTAGGQFTSLELENSPKKPLTDTWMKLEATLTITKPGGTLNIFVGADTNPGACMLLDDVYLERLK